MTLSIIVLGLVTIQRLGELVFANRNTSALLARGGVETGARHYPLIVALHGLWLLGLWAVAWNRPINLIGLALFFGLQLLRAWIIVSLGKRWTTRIITMPGAPLVRRGPYRFLKHPNYLVVVAEIAVLPLAFGMVGYALIFSAANTALLWVRIREENLALRQSAQNAY